MLLLTIYFSVVKKTSFIDKIEYSGHRFIDFEEIVNNFNDEEIEEEEEKGKDKIRKIAQYAETIHKKANNEKKKFFLFRRIC